MLGRLNKCKAEHPKDPPLDATARPGARSWGRLHHMKEVARLMEHIPLADTLTHKQNEGGRTITTDHLDPKTGARCEFESWVAIAWGVSSPYAVRKATDTREILWELEQLADRTVLQPLHAQMHKTLEVEPASGHRAPPHM